jgi:hypothetical protein
MRTIIRKTTDFSTFRLKKALIFMKEAHALCKVPEQTRLFICPLCGGRVYARKSGYNGHVYAQCLRCKTGIRE